MVTHVHKVIHKVVSTFASSAGFGEETEVKKVTGSDQTWPQGHQRVWSVQAEARAKGFSERTLAAVHPVHFCKAEDAGDQTQCVSVRCK
jgi:hypothetical protein